MTRKNPFDVNLRGANVAAAILVSIFVLVLAACGGEDSTGGAQENQDKQQTTRASVKDETERAAGEAPRTATTVEDTLEPAEARIGPRENSNMEPAGGKKPDPAQPPPEDPPEGVETFPATANRIVNGEVEYAREPPTNGDHALLWQNCGFYENPVRDENAVHSLDHGAVWITYREDLPPGQIDMLRQLARERYVLVSPYPGQRAPVIATAWSGSIARTTRASGSSWTSSG